MTVSTLRRTAGQPAPPVFPELSVVALTHDVNVDGAMLPNGSRGTVVYVYQTGVAYEVEFEEPFHAVVTLEPGDLTA